MRHGKGEIWAGVDIVNEGIANNLENFVWEPTAVKINAIQAATEAACLILSVDETVKNQESEQPQGGPPVCYSLLSPLSDLWKLMCVVYADASWSSPTGFKGKGQGYAQAIDYLVGE
jgi:hypothetical protein